MHAYDWNTHLWMSAYGLAYIWTCWFHVADCHSFEAKVFPMDHIWSSLWVPPKWNLSFFLCVGLFFFFEMNVCASFLLGRSAYGLHLDLLECPSWMNAISLCKCQFLHECLHMTYIWTLWASPRWMLINDGGWVIKGSLWIGFAKNWPYHYCNPLFWGFEVLMIFQVCRFFLGIQSSGEWWPEVD